VCVCVYVCVYACVCMVRYCQTTLGPRVACGTNWNSVYNEAALAFNPHVLFTSPSPSPSGPNGYLNLTINLQTMYQVSHVCQ